MLINAIVGFSTVEAEKIDLMRSLVASRWQTFRIVIFPNSLPFIFAGLNVAIVLSITGALVGEFICADRGLGNLLPQLNFNMDISGMFAVLVVLAVTEPIANPSSASASVTRKFSTSRPRS